MSAITLQHTQLQHDHSPGLNIQQNLLQPGLSPERVQTFLSMSPEMNLAHTTLEERCSHLHDDSKLNDFALVFRAALRTCSMGTALSTTEKAQKIYMLHASRITNSVAKQHKDRVVGSTLAMLNGSLQNETVREQLTRGFAEALIAKISQLYSCFPHLALARAMELPLEQVPSMRVERGVSIIPDTQNPIAASSLYKELL